MCALYKQLFNRIDPEIIIYTYQYKKNVNSKYFVFDQYYVFYLHITIQFGLLSVIIFFNGSLKPTLVFIFIELIYNIRVSCALLINVKLYNVNQT